MNQSLKKQSLPRDYLRAYLAQLQLHPLRTKGITSATLAILQELVVTYGLHSENEKPKLPLDRMIKRAVYCVLIGAPMGHTAISWLQRAFAGKVGFSWRMLQLAVNNFVVVPVQSSVYLTSMAIISGAKSVPEIKVAFRKSIWPVLRTSWVSQPLALAIAQQFIPPELWVPWLNLVAFVVGVYITYITKKNTRAVVENEKKE